LGLTEWFLLIVVVILIPLVIAVMVTLWSLEQARLRSKKNRRGPVRRVALPAAIEAADAPADETSQPSPTDPIPPPPPVA
jgi:hypothetical protein